MRGIIDPSDFDMPVRNVNFIDTAGILREPPIGGKRNIGQLNEHRAVDAVMGNQDHGLVRMPFVREAQCVG